MRKWRKENKPVDETVQIHWDIKCRLSAKPQTGSWAEDITVFVISLFHLSQEKWEVIHTDTNWLVILHNNHTSSREKQNHNYRAFVVRGCQLFHERCHFFQMVDVYLDVAEEKVQLVILLTRIFFIGKCSWWYPSSSLISFQ